MNILNKSAFKNKLLDSYIQLNHISDRKLDYKYHEYNLFILLNKHTKNHDFSILGMPDNLEIVTYPLDNDYNINARTHVTLNMELYKLYDCGYFVDEKQFIKYVNAAITQYNKGIPIKKLARHVRNTRLKYIDSSEMNL